MKGSAVALAASIVAASSTILASFTDPKSSASLIGMAKEVEPSSAMDRFAPKFDGLRFIETLVTAHR